MLKPCQLYWIWLYSMQYLYNEIIIQRFTSYFIWSDNKVNDYNFLYLGDQPLWVKINRHKILAFLTCYTLVFCRSADVKPIPQTWACPIFNTVPQPICQNTCETRLLSWQLHYVPTWMCTWLLQFASTASTHKVRNNVMCCDRAK